MLENGVDTFVEIGPGKTLAGFMRKIAPKATVYNVSSFEDAIALENVCQRREVKYVRRKNCSRNRGIRGIGRAIAKELALKGAFVIVNYNGSKQAADETVNEITQAGGKAVGVQCNVADAAECEAL